MEGRLYHRLPTRDTVRLLLAPALAFIAAGVDRGYQTDLWQHLARGRLIAAERAVVAVDRFTFTAAGEPLVDNNWLTQLLFYAVHSLAGLEGLQALNAAILAATFAVLAALCRRASGSTALAAAAGVGAFLGLWQTFLIRPQSLSMLLFVALYALLTAARRRPRLLLFAPAMFVLWANVHGGFAVGLALVFAHVVGATWERAKPFLLLCAGDEGGEGALHDRESLADENPRALTRSRRERGSIAQLFPLVACLVVSAAATLANPYGWNVYRYAGKLSAVGVARGVEEWMPPGLRSLNGVVFFASLVLLGALVAFKRRPTVREALLLACFAVPACFSTRMTVWWFLAAAPVIARLAARPRSGEASEPEPARPSLAAAAVCVSLVTVSVLSLPWLESYNPAMRRFRPAHRLESDLRAVADTLPAGREGESGGGHTRARVFTRMEWANYLSWAAADRSAVFVEGHVELYPDATWQRYLTVTRGQPGWDAVLDEAAVDYLLLDTTYHVTLMDRVNRSGVWSRRAAAGPAVLFERRAATAGNGSGFPASDERESDRTLEKQPVPTPSTRVVGGDF